MKTIHVPEAIGNPETGYIIQTPWLPLRKWPRWTLRPHFRDYPLLAQRWDSGGDWDDRYIEEMERFVLDTHSLHYGARLAVFEVIEDGVLYVPSILVFPEHRGNGLCSRYLDSMRPDVPICFPEVVNIKLAQMLHRRGFVGTVAEYDQDDNWIPVHVRGFEEMPDIPNIIKEKAKRGKQ